MLTLPGHVSLANELAADLLDGRIVTLSGQPSSGRSSVLTLVEDQLDSLVSTVCVRASHDPEKLNLALEEVEVAAASGETVACLVDDFGLVLATEGGVAFQGRLHAVATGGPGADAVGVLLVGRVNESLTRWPGSAPGSPIAAAAHRNAQMGLLAAQDIRDALAADGVTRDEATALVDFYGGHLHLIALARAAASGHADENLVERAVYRGVAETTGVTEHRLMDLARKPGQALASTAVDGLLAPLVYYPAPGRTALSRALVDRGLPSLLVASQASWPGEIHRSARRFRCRLEGMAYPLWVDRYLGAHLRGLIDFMDVLAQRDCETDLRLLGSEAGTQGVPPAAKAMFDQRLAAWSASGLRVSWRLAAAADYDLIHQRQLISPTRLAGYVLPPCDRIIGVGAQTNESDALLSRARVTLLERAWARALPYA